MRRASVYAAGRGLTLGPQLGFGKDGIVFAASNPARAATAIKTLLRRELYDRELACYLRLRERGVIEMRGHAVPLLRGHDAVLLIVEMSIVTRPFVLDFASAYVDRAPEFPREIMEERWAHWAETFEADWPSVLAIVAAFRQIGIHLLDLNPGNIAFAQADGLNASI